LKVGQLVSKFEKAGGVFVLDESRRLSVTCRPGLTRNEQRDLRRLDCLVRKHAYLVTAWILERIASWTWERDYACHCPARPFAHPAHKSEDVWKELGKLAKKK
jgi:hypothetical protein